MAAGDDRPYFLEMNTRLQVEHPVTEFVTGVDLVEWQLLAAAGEALPLGQDEILVQGHAIEARITAERADRDFQPAAGRVAWLAPPRGPRFDSGVETGSEVGLYYDSLLAKLIAHGATRESALSRLAAGLRSLTLLGVPTTQAFLLDAVAHPLFLEGRATTSFIETAFPGGWKPSAEALASLRAAAAAVWSRPVPEASATNPWLRRDAFRVTASTRPARAMTRVSDEYGDGDVDLLVDRDGLRAEVDGAPVTLGRGDPHDDRVAFSRAGRAFAVRRDGERIHIARDGLAISARVALTIDIPRAPDARAPSGNVVTAPLHGVVAQIHVAVGDRVVKGDAVLVMEAMKLVHTLTAPVSGRVAFLGYRAGDTVPAGAALIEISSTVAEEDT
jgi:acetyl/propionyl-CoA carboxylase alpha subunit